ncbi:hypothetical protein [Luteibaculum oceani]|uniref:Uncharacterized protein n=1 Tax=Luteibaculum oceani TaxID=1294296 RepID=A0A5C6UQ04_9FLAO|nr:hypothetical protein [Luteibaculum oceani]TXC75247.1 hypothetical protein FRX97_12050 [Luteibaculum oceani]
MGETIIGSENILGASRSPGFTEPWVYYRSDYIPEGQLIIDDTLKINFCSSSQYDSLQRSIGQKVSWLIEETSAGNNFAVYKVAYEFTEEYYQDLLDVWEEKKESPCH